MRLAVVGVLAVAACADDPTLRVDVEHEVVVERTTISVYESDSLTCERIEFGELDEDELEATRVALLTIDAGGVTSGSLADLSRTDRKMIVARGYIGDGLVTAGCSAHDEIVGRDQVKVTTVRASSASIGQLSLDTADPFSLQVSLRDANGAALDRNPVSWRVYAPYGAEPAAATPAPEKDEISGVWHLAKPTCTNQNGAVRIHPVPPATVGGFAIQVRPSWPIETPPLISGFTRIDPAVSPTIPVPDFEHPCAVRRGGAAPSLLCVELLATGNPTLVLREYTVSVAAGDVSIAKLGGDYPIDQDTIALYGVDRGAVRDVYAINKRGRIFGLRNPSKEIVGGSPPRLLTDTATNAMLLPACGANPPRIALRTESAMLNRLVVMDEAEGTGGPVSTFHNVVSTTMNAIDIRSVGCVAELTPKGDATLRHAIVVDVPQRVGMGGRQRSVVFDCIVGPDAPSCFVDLPILAAAAEFTPDGYLAAANLDASGVVISKFAVLPDPQGYRRVEFGRVAAAALPKHIVYGDFDSDGKSDAFWDIENLGGTAAALQVTYAQLAGALPLSALSASQGFSADDLFVDDVTGDGKDDVILIGKSFTDAGVPLGYGVIVIPTQVPAPVPGLSTSDDPCPP